MEDTQGFGYTDEIFQWPIAKMNLYDVWDYIFKHYLTSATDQKNLLVASSQFFGPFLEQKKCSILLGSVLHVLYKHKHLCILDIGLLMYRSLSKWCRESLDRSLDLDNPCFQNLDGMDHDICDPQHSCWLDKSWQYDVMQRNQFIAIRLRDVDPVNSSFQIPWGCLTFPGADYYNPDREHQKFRFILSKVGTQIHHFKYRTDSSVSPWNISYASLLEFLGQMPNLRTLKISDIAAYRATSNGLPECRSLMESQPLPNLDDLTTLKVSRFPALILDALMLKYANKLENLSIISDDARGKQGKEGFLQRTDLLSGVNNISQLSIGLISTKEGVHRWFHKNIDTFLSLKNLSVYIEQWRENRSSTVFMEICRILEENSGALSRLRTFNLFIRGGRTHAISHRYGRPKFICCSIRLNLPSIKRLWINAFDVYFSSLDFILGLENLEELVINLEQCLPIKAYRVEQIKFVGCWNRMEESNVWELMPKLKIIKLRSKEWPSSGLWYQCYKFVRPTLKKRP